MGEALFPFLREEGKQGFQLVILRAATHQLASGNAAQWGSFAPQVMSRSLNYDAVDHPI